MTGRVKFGRKNLRDGEPKEKADERDRADERNGDIRRRRRIKMVGLVLKRGKLYDNLFN